jgi:hypothetical protein
VLTDVVYPDGRLKYPKNDKNYPYPFDFEKYPIIAFNEEKSEKQMITSEGPLLELKFNEYTIFPYKGIIVFENDAGNEEILTYNGTQITEPDGRTYIRDESAIFDDSEYLIFTKESI